jgi:hypothetical protein
MPKTAPRDPSFSTVDLKPVIYNPDALPMYADQTYRESLHQKEKRAKKMKPQEGVSGVGKGGRLGASEQQSLVRNMFPYVPCMGNADEQQQAQIRRPARGAVAVCEERRRGRVASCIVHVVFIFYKLLVHGLVSAQVFVAVHHVRFTTVVL